MKKTKRSEDQKVLLLEPTNKPSDLLIFLLILFVSACGKGKATTAAAPSASSATSGVDAGAAAEGDDGALPMGAREVAQWAAAKEGDPEELMRLADLVTCTGLHERSVQQPELRPTALAAATYCRDFSELPWLAQVGTEGSDAEARAALDAIVDLAARPRRSVDPEDADELHTGCATLLTLARTPDRPRDRRVLAIRALRMLADYGCVKRPDIPTDLDAK
jgi:hypothetical protein